MLLEEFRFWVAGWMAWHRSEALLGVLSFFLGPGLCLSLTAGHVEKKDRKITAIGVTKSFGLRLPCKVMDFRYEVVTLPSETTAI